MTSFDDLKRVLNESRAEIQTTANRVRALMDRPELEITHGVTPEADARLLGEAKANVMLAYRHLEDARMRLGKVIQSLEGGVSCFDKSA